MSLYDVITKLNEDIKNRRTVALVTIISVTGSTPQNSGSKMLVYPDGSIFGTIGGGKFEYLTIKQALKAIKEGKNAKVTFDLTPAAMGALCMGRAEVLIEVYKFPIKIVILGAGHVAKSLSILLDYISFPYVVVDERTEFANRNNFPNAVSIINKLPYKAMKDVDIDKDTYIVIMTPDHRMDRECLIQAIKTDACYIGMIGSKNKVGEIFKDLNKKKIYPQKDKRIYSPIGLSIGGKTPQEISISIVSEILSVFYNSKIKHMRDIV